ncbi:nucleoside deaminase [Dinghuibacter silviterrae]|uniref:Guanine deaminase n=1 Tax=Dinghuibacter silviterrae TaxID=1539049 RepID=A0A4R8DSD9_9BACT|nr:nucleoside deaminase [Dinghuibacter silviterrae]TDX00776.1 guanine deaminase [Dinghuibacter silviterrae]
MQPAEIRYYLQRAIDLSREGMTAAKGGPFGCVIVKDGVLLAEGYNRVTSENDPTAHAEVVAIREACRKLGTFQLEGCLLFSSCEPCPMCLGAIYWARPMAVYFAATRGDAARAGFDDAVIYGEIALEGADRSIPFTHVPMEGAEAVFEEWVNKAGRKEY